MPEKLSFEPSRIYDFVDEDGSAASVMIREKFEIKKQIYILVSPYKDGIGITDPDTITAYKLVRKRGKESLENNLTDEELEAVNALWQEKGRKVLNITPGNILRLNVNGKDEEVKYLGVFDLGGNTCMAVEYMDEEGTIDFFIVGENEEGNIQFLPLEGSKWDIARIIWNSCCE